MTSNQYMFTGLKFLGVTLDLMPDKMTWRGMPNDAVPFRDFIPAQTDLNKIREWAIKQGMVTEPDVFITEEVAEEISKLFAPEDHLSIAVQVSPSSVSSDDYLYLEYPFVPMSTLTKKGLEVDIVYWAMSPDDRRWGEHSDHNGVRFGFWSQGCPIEFVSVSYAKTVAQKFEDLLHRLSTTYPVVALGDAGHIQGEAEITVNGDVKARFFKVGTAHGVQFTSSSSPYWEREREMV